MPVLTGSPLKRSTVTNRGDTLTIEVDPFDTLRLTSLVEAKLSGTNLREFLTERVQKHFSTQIAIRFGSGGDAKSGKWAQLTDATQDIRAALGVPPAQPINVRTALLGNRNSLFDFVTTHYDVRSGADWAELDLPGTPDDPVQAQKLATAQMGSTNNPLGYNDTPARPVLAVDESDLQDVMEMLQGYVMLEVAGAVQGGEIDFA